MGFPPPRSRPLGSYSPKSDAFLASGLLFSGEAAGGLLNFLSPQNPQASFRGYPSCPILIPLQGGRRLFSGFPAIRSAQSGKEFATMSHILSHNGVSRNLKAVFIGKGQIRLSIACPRPAPMRLPSHDAAAGTAAFAVPAGRVGYAPERPFARRALPCGHFVLSPSYPLAVFWNLGRIGVGIRDSTEWKGRKRRPRSKNYLTHYQNA